tara:strand:+ start:2608 stop:2772 length:165 start_codon:yes stop_codon:yes gene_type:complete
MKAKESSIIVKSSERIEKDQLMAPTWFVLVPVLILSLIVLKKFIYITDEKRDDQ